MICERCHSVLEGSFTLRELRQLPNPTPYQQRLIELLEANLPKENEQ